MSEYRLKDLVKIKNGRDHKSLADGVYPVYGSGGLMRMVDSYLYDKPSILLPRKGTLNNIQYSDQPFWTVDTLYYTEINQNKVDAYYLYYYLKLLDLNSLSSGTGVPSMTFGAYNGIKVKLPQLDIQKKISTLLRAIDKKIELNNRINAELEAMAKTLYDYWFVQFDFPDDSPQGQGKPYKTSGGKMVYNPTLKREIPEGWEVDTLSSWIASDKTGDWGKEEQEGNYTLQVDCIRGADINGLNGNGKIAAPNRFILEKNDHKLLAPFDLVIEISGGSPTQSTGRMAYITDDVLDRFTHPLICSNFCKAISLRNKDLFYCFAYLWNAATYMAMVYCLDGKGKQAESKTYYLIHL